MAERKLTPAEALVAATRAMATVDPKDTVVSVSFGEFRDGGAYWSVTWRRELGNTRSAKDPFPQGVEHRDQLLTCAFTEAWPTPPTTD